MYHRRRLLEIHALGQAVGAQTDDPGLLGARREGTEERVPLGAWVPGREQDPARAVPFADQAAQQGERDGSAVESEQQGVLLEQSNQ